MEEKNRGGPCQLQTPMKSGAKKGMGSFNPLRKKVTAERGEAHNFATNMQGKEEIFFQFSISGGRRVVRRRVSLLG